MMRIVRLAAGLAATLALVACSHFHPTQEAHTALVRSGSYDDFAARTPPGPIAARLVPYALLAEQAYRTDVYRTGRAQHSNRPCPDDGGGCGGLAADAARANRMLDGWRLVYAQDGPFACPAGQSCGASVGGLGVQVWVSRGPVCREGVIAFRGTVGHSLGDWVSNAHWVTRALPVSAYDEYSQVHDHIGWLVERIRRDRCYRSGTTRISALGHSLGGGLAQHAAYAEPAIRRVYAFDPSFVTGYYDKALKNRDRTVRGLQIERVYEHGEILAFGRYVLRQFNPPTACDPTIVNIRFNVLEGSVIDQHSLVDFTTALLRDSRGVAPEQRPFVAEACAWQREHDAAQQRLAVR